MNISLPAFIPTLACLAGFASTSVFADTLLDFGSSTYVTTNPNFSRTVSASGSGPFVYTNAFSSTTPLTPTSGYTGPAIYGGYQITSTAQAVNILERIANNTAISSVNYDVPLITADRTESTWSGTLTVGGVMLLNLDAPASIDGFTAITTKSGSSVNTVTCRWVVGIDDSYYVSNLTFTAPNNGGTSSLTGASLLSTTWALYDPATSLSFSGSSFSALSLTNVSSVGVYFSASQTLASNAGSRGFGFGLADMDITGTAMIPEPSTYTLLLGGGILAVAMLRRRLR